MKLFPANIVSLDLTKMESVEQIQKILDSYTLVDIDAKKCFELRKGYSKILFDLTIGVTFGTIEIGSTNVLLTKNYNELFSQIEPMEEIVEPSPVVEYDFTTDEVLDKIASHGENSLTEAEKAFLSLVSRGLIKG